MFPPLNQKPLDNVIYSLDKDNPKLTNFYRRIITKDIDKSWCEYISEAKSQYLLIDASCLRIKLIQCHDSFITNIYTGLNATNVLQTLIDEKYLPSDISYLNAEQVSNDLLFSCLQKYLELITKKFKQNRIIIFNITQANYFITQDKSIDCFNPNCKYDVVEIGLQYFLSQLPNAHYIDLPKNVIGNQNHKWGICELHYVDEYYEYAYEALKIITQKKYKTIRNEKFYLLQLKNNYEKIIHDKYFPFFYHELKLNSNNNVKNLFSIEDLAGAGEYYKNGIKLLMHNNFDFHIEGTAQEDTTFYLISKSKNPVGVWESLKKTIFKGKYLFTTCLPYNPEKVYSQLVLSNGNEYSTKWIAGNFSTTFELSEDYQFQLLRVVIKKGSYVKTDGHLSLKKIP